MYDTSLIDLKTLLSRICFNESGLMPVIVQDATTHVVLMQAWMNQQALEKTISRGQAVFWSRSRQELWHKGLTSGNYLNVQEVLIDCDGDTLLLLVSPTGPACHTGKVSCFFQQLS